MGKHKKAPAKQATPVVDRDIKPDNSPSDEASPLADVETGLREAFEACRAMAASGDAPVQVLRELGGLGRAITSVQAERRAQTKARQYTAKNIPFEVVMEHLRGLTAERRGHVVQELIRMDDEGSVLG